jgi:hypothetical protein
MKYPWMIVGCGTEGWGVTVATQTRGDPQPNVEVMYSYDLPEAVSYDDAQAINGKLRVYYTRTEEEANALAFFLAKRFPQRQWFVSPIKSVWQAPITAPTGKALTDKGLVPF